MSDQTQPEPEQNTAEQEQRTYPVATDERATSGQLVRKIEPRIVVKDKQQT